MAKADPLNGKLVVLIGGSGFVGRHVAQELLARGARLRIACRHPEKAFKLKPLAKLGQIQFARCDVTKPGEVTRVMSGANAAAYCVGAFKGDLMGLHARGAEEAAQAAAAGGAESFVLVSAIGADPESASTYAATKGKGEELVRAAFPKATILRPSVLFGEDDKFITMFASLIAAIPVLPVFGADKPFQPLSVDDAAEAIGNALGNPGKYGGKTFELGGPEVITMGELNRKIAAAQHRQRTFVEVPDVVSGVVAALPLTPITRDQWIMLKTGSVASGKLPGCKELGIAAKPLELWLDSWMVRFRKHGRFGAGAGATG